MTIAHEALCRDVVTYARRMVALDMVEGTSGNVSARVPGQERFLITPSSVPYPDLTPADIMMLDFEGEVLTEGRVPSVEHTMHLAIYRQRPDVGAVCHTHSPYATALSFLRQPLPPLLEEMIVYVGGQVDVAQFAPSGSEELAGFAARAMGGKAAALLANHGVVCAGRNLDVALQVAQVVERTAKIYMIARNVGTPHALPEDAVEMYATVYEYRRDEG